MTGTPQQLADAVAAALSATTPPTAKKKLKSLTQLINTQVTLPKAKGAAANAPTVVVPSPLNDATKLPDLLPTLLDKLSIKEELELTPRMNVNTAPREVLLALTALSAPSSTTTTSATATTGTTTGTTASTGTATTSTTATSPTALTEADVDAILAARQGLSPDDPAVMTGAWLMTAAGIKPATFQKLEKYITGRSMVYRVQSVGYFGQGGPTARVEAVVDTNRGNPRFLSFRDLSDLDSPRGFEPQR